MVSSLVFLVAQVFILLVVVFVAIALGVRYRGTPTTTDGITAPAPTDSDLGWTYAYRTPDDWDGEEPLRHCSTCAGFNHAQYRMCRYCASSLTTGSTVVTPDRIEVMQNRYRAQRSK